MSKIFVTERLHREWRRVCIELSNPERFFDAECPPIPAPTAAEPPPEEWGEVLNVITSFLISGEIGRNSALSVALEASVLGVPMQYLYPIYYALGWERTPDGQHQLGLDVGSTGHAVVMTGEFPLWPRLRSLMPDHYRPQNRRYDLVRHEFMNRPTLCYGDGGRFLPTWQQFTPETRERDNDGLEMDDPHPWDVPLTGTVVAPTPVNQDGLSPTMLTTGTRFGFLPNVRLATPEEINTIFHRDIVPGVIYELGQYNARSFFDAMGLLNLYEDAISRMPAQRSNTPAERPPAGPAQATNVPPPPPRLRGSARTRAVLQGMPVMPATTRRTGSRATIGSISSAAGVAAASLYADLEDETTRPTPSPVPTPPRMIFREPSTVVEATQGTVSTATAQEMPTTTPQEFVRSTNLWGAFSAAAQPAGAPTPVGAAASNSVAVGAGSALESTPRVLSEQIYYTASPTGVSRREQEEAIGLLTQNHNVMLCFTSGGSAYYSDGRINFNGITMID